MLTWLHLLGILIASTIVTYALSSLYRRWLFRTDAGAGCTCLDDLHYRQDCPLHGWPRTVYVGESNNVLLVNREGRLVKTEKANDL